MAETRPPAPEHRWVHHESVESTNDVVLAAARRGEGAGLWVTADRQLKGRGRGGRAWASEPGNFHGSHLYVTARPVAGLSLLPLTAGLAVRDAVAELLAGRQAVGETAERAADYLPANAGRSPTPSGFLSPPGRGQGEGANVGRNGSESPSPGRFAADLSPEGRGELALKWPNDVLVGGRKLAGILLESEALADGRTAVAIGCGVNLAHHPADAAHPATHLAEHGAACTIADMLPVLARRMAEALALFEGEPARIAQRWLAAAHGIGGPIRVRLPSASLSGTFAGLDGSGRLILEEAGGTRRLISAGEVFFGAAAAAEESAA